MKNTLTPLLALIGLFVTPMAEARIGKEQHSNSRRRNLSSLRRLQPRAEAEVRLKPSRNTIWRKALLSAAGGRSSCDNPSVEYLRMLVEGMGMEAFNTIIDYEIDQLPMYYNLLRDEVSNEYFGAFGEETKEVKAAHEDCIEFWKSATLATDNIDLLGMHASFMKDTDKLLPLLRATFDLSDTDWTYHELALAIQDFIVSLPFEYENPLLTFNAFAYSDYGRDERIVIGDGVLQYLHYWNVGGEGPEYILAHEFGHQVQYESSLIMIDDRDEEGTPEESRRIELQADALAGYFLAHTNGAHMKGHQITELYEAAFSVGDCSFDEDGHHGTPAQRECALIWGTRVGVESGNAILHPTEFAELYEQDLAKILALDEEMCPKPASDSSRSPEDEENRVDFPFDIGQLAAKLREHRFHQ